MAKKTPKPAKKVPEPNLADQLRKSIKVAKAKKRDKPPEAALPKAEMKPPAAPTAPATYYIHPATKVKVTLKHPVDPKLFGTATMTLGTETYVISDTEPDGRIIFQERSTAFLIERYVNSELLYWCGRGLGDWRPQASEAVRFARSQDAATVLGWMLSGMGRVTQHWWNLGIVQRSSR